jgi:hypothetical protein
MPTLMVYYDDVGKVFDVSEDGKLVKDGSRFPNVTEAETVAFNNLADYAAFLDANIERQFCFTHGVPVHDGKYVAVTKEAKESAVRRELLGQWSDRKLVRRSHDDLFYRPGHIFCTIDYDAGPTNVLTEAEVWAQLCDAEPGLQGRAWIGYASTSAYLKIDGAFISQRRGCRLLFNAHLPYAAKKADGAELRNCMAAIHNRLVILGHYRVEIQNTGKLVLKTAVDLAVYKAAQPDFAGKPIFLSDRLSRERPPIVFGHGDEEPFDLSTIKPLTPEEMARVREIEAAERVKHAEKMRETYEAYHSERDARELPGSGLTVEQLRARRRVTEAGNFLPIETMIHVDREGWVSGRAILADPSAYNGLTCASPVDPYYGSTNGKPGRHKGKIKVRHGEIVITDYAHGSFTEYRFIGNVTLDTFLANLTDLDTPAPADAQLPLDTGLDIVEPPVPARPYVAPVVPLANVQAEAIATLGHSGAIVATGLDLALAVLTEQLASRRFTLTVPDTATAASLKQWLAQLFPDKSIMVMPGRSTDAKEQRKRYGSDVFAYPSDFPGQVEGRFDDVCPKAAAIRKLEKAGRYTVSGATCLLRLGQGPAARVLRCPHYHTCGFNLRVQAKGRADIVIRTNAALLSETNPVIEPAGQPEFLASLDVFDRPLSDLHTWPLRVWEDQPELAMVLDIIRHGGAPADLPHGVLGRLEIWAGQDDVRPDMDVAASLTAAEDYAQEAAIKTGRSLPPLTALEAVRGWLEGMAEIRIAAGDVKVFLKRTLTAIEEAIDLIVAGSPLRARSLAGAHPGALERHSLNLPKRIIQIATNLGHRVTGHDGQAKGQLLDLSALLRWLESTYGPGVYLAETGGLGHLLPGAKAIDFHNMNLATAASMAPSFAAAGYVAVIGRIYPSDDSLIRSALDLPNDERPPCLANGEIFKMKVRARYRMRQGRELVYGNSWRWAGADDAMDRVFAGMVAGPVLYLAEATARAEAVTGRTIPFLVFDAFPLHAEGMPRAGLVLDELVNLGDVLPRAAWLETEVNGLTQVEAAKVLGISDRGARKAITGTDQAEQAAMIERWKRWMRG